MKRLFLFLAAIVLLAMPLSAVTQTGTDWHTRLHQELPLLGHRNWILIADSAYPLQVSPGVEVIETGADQLQVTREVLAMLDHSIHVTPLIYLDKELPYLTDQSAPGIRVYRDHLNDLLKDRPVQSALHADLLHQIDQAGQTYHVVVLKTTMALPYTTVFLNLDCKYWPPQAEQQLRQAMRIGVKQ